MLWMDAYLMERAERGRADGEVGTFSWPLGSVAHVQGTCLRWSNCLGSYSSFNWSTVCEREREREASARYPHTIRHPYLGLHLTQAFLPRVDLDAVHPATRTLHADNLRHDMRTHAEQRPARGGGRNTVPANVPYRLAGQSPASFAGSPIKRRVVYGSILGAPSRIGLWILSLLDP
jgi:hypothetical protein